MKIIVYEHLVKGRERQKLKGTIRSLKNQKNKGLYLSKEELEKIELLEERLATKILDMTHLKEVIDFKRKERMKKLEQKILVISKADYLNEDKYSKFLSSEEGKNGKFDHVIARSIKVEGEGFMSLLVIRN